MARRRVSIGAACRCLFTQSRSLPCFRPAGGVIVVYAQLCLDALRGRFALVAVSSILLLDPWINASGIDVLSAVGIVSLLLRTQPRRLVVASLFACCGSWSVKCLSGARRAFFRDRRRARIGLELSGVCRSSRRIERGTKLAVAWRS